MDTEFPPPMPESAPMSLGAWESLGELGGVKRGLKVLFFFGKHERNWQANLDLILKIRDEYVIDSFVVIEMSGEMYKSFKY